MLFLSKNKEICDYNHVINELQDYRLDTINLNKSIFYKKDEQNTSDNISKKSNTTDSKNNLLKKSYDNKEKDSKIFPKQKDNLFWCFYMMVHGEENYEKIQPINLIVEKKIKIEYIEKIRQNKIMLKQHKYATLIHIENLLLNESKIDIETFFSLCVIENLNIFYIHKKTYYEMRTNDENKTFILHHLNVPYQKYGFEVYEHISGLENYRKTLFQIEKLDKPVKAIGSYKIKELQDFCSKLSIEIFHTETNKAKNKKELYEALIQYF